MARYHPPIARTRLRIGKLGNAGAYDGEAVYEAIAERHPEAAVIIPPRDGGFR